MSSKLKAKPRKQRFPLAQSNQAAQAFGRAMVNCHSQIKSMEREAYPMRRKTPCFSYGDIRRVHRIYASN